MNMRKGRLAVIVILLVHSSEGRLFAQTIWAVVPPAGYITGTNVFRTETTHDHIPVEAVILDFAVPGRRHLAVTSSLHSG